MDSGLTGVWDFKSSMAKSTAEAMQLLKAADPDTHPPFPQPMSSALQRSVLHLFSGSRENVLEEDMSRTLTAWLYKTVIFKLATLAFAAFYLLPE